MKQKVSVIIPWMNSGADRLAALYYTLALVRAQYKNVGEIIVVEQGGETDLPSWVRRAPSPFDGKLFSRAIAGNAGAAAAKFPQLCIHDNDTLLRPKHFVPAEAGTLYIPLISQVALQAGPTLDFYAKTNPKTVDLLPVIDKYRKFRRYGMSPGGVQVISAEDFKLAGGFNEGYEGHGGGDFDFQRRCRAAGIASVYPKGDWDAVGVHLHHEINTTGRFNREGAS